MFVSKGDDSAMPSSQRGTQMQNFRGDTSPRHASHHRANSWSGNWEARVSVHARENSKTETQHITTRDAISPSPIMVSFFPLCILLSFKAIRSFPQFAADPGLTTDTSLDSRIFAETYAALQTPKLDARHPLADALDTRKQ